MNTGKSLHLTAIYRKKKKYWLKVQFMLLLFMHIIKCEDQKRKLLNLQAHNKIVYIINALSIT